MSLKFKPTFLTLNMLVFSCLFMFNAQAAVVNDTLELNASDPDFVSSGIAIDYVNTGGNNFTFTAQGQAVKLTDGGNEFLIGGAATFDITAFVDTSTDMASGTLNISGTIASEGYVSGTLLTGDLTQIGGPNDTINFLFDVTGGDAAGLFGNTAGVVMGLFTGYSSTASFDSAFSNASLGAISVADTFKVPVPYTLPLFLLGLGVLVMRSKNRV